MTFLLHVLRCRSCNKPWSSTRRDRRCPFCGSNQITTTGRKRGVRK